MCGSLRGRNSSSARRQLQLRQADANKVALPTLIGGKRLASMMMKSNAVDFLDVMVHDEQPMLVLEELVITEHSCVANQSLAEILMRRKTGILVVASKDPSGRFNTNPSPETKVKEGDVLIVIGQEEKINEFRMNNRIMCNALPTCYPPSSRSRFFS